MKKLCFLFFAWIPCASFASEACDAYYKEMDAYTELMTSYSDEVDVLKAQNEQSKKDLQAMPEVVREAVCKEGLINLKKANEQLKTGSN